MEELCPLSVDDSLRFSNTEGDGDALLPINLACFSVCLILRGSLNIHGRYLFASSEAEGQVQSAVRCLLIN